MYKKFKALLLKYHQGTASSTEEAVVDQFFNAMQKGGVTAEEVKSNRQLYVRLHRKIHAKIAPSFFRSSFIKYGSIAASLLAIAVLYFFMSMNTEVKQIVQQAKKGEQLMFYLSDSTLVYLNSNSTLQYPAQFTSSSREVILKGEAYFNVRSDAQKPFIVHSSNLSTTVLGTIFNIRDFDLETTVVSVHEGRVKVKSMTNEEVILAQNEQAEWDKTTQKLSKEGVDLHDANQWITGRIQFDTTSIAEVIQVLNRRFNKTIVWEPTSQAQSDYTISGDFKGTDIEEVLQGIHFLYNLQYTKVSETQYKLYLDD